MGCSAPRPHIEHAIRSVQSSANIIEWRWFSCTFAWGCAGGWKRFLSDFISISWPAEIWCVAHLPFTISTNENEQQKKYVWKLVPWKFQIFVFVSTRQENKFTLSTHSWHVKTFTHRHHKLGTFESCWYYSTYYTHVPSFDTYRERAQATNYNISVNVMIWFCEIGEWFFNFSWHAWWNCEWQNTIPSVIS